MELQTVILAIAGFFSAYYFRELVDSVKQLNEQVAKILVHIDVHSQEITRLRDDVDGIKEKL